MQQPLAEAPMRATVCLRLAHQLACAGSFFFLSERSPRLAAMRTGRNTATAAWSVPERGDLISCSQDKGSRKQSVSLVSTKGC
jgi:hypothetical protein